MKVLSLFSGAMGLDLGAESAGMEIKACCEIDKWCCETITRNRPKIRLYQGSVSDLDPATIGNELGLGDSFVLIGGPPCQSFSSGGNRAGLNDARGNLVFEYFRFVRELQPAAFIFENVGNLLTAALRHRPIHLRPGKDWNLSKYNKNNATNGDGNPALEEDEMSGSAFRYLLDELHSLRYSLTFGVVNAADYGAPQKRIRFVMLGFRDVGQCGLPQPTHGELTNNPHVSLRDAISDLSADPGPHSIYTEGIARLFRQVPPGGNWKDLPIEDQKLALGGSFHSGGGKTGFMRRLSWDAPAPTLTTKANRKGTSLCHPEKNRPLSVYEYRRIQGFPDNWKFSGAMNQQYQQIGNAVPVQLGQALAHKVIETLNEAKPKHELSKTELKILTEEAIVKLRSFARNNKSKKNIGGPVQMSLINA